MTITVDLLVKKHLGDTPRTMPALVGGKAVTLVENVGDTPLRAIYALAEDLNSIGRGVYVDGDLKAIVITKKEG